MPKALVRQSLPVQTWADIPDEILTAYRTWRPTPLRRARRLESALGSRARIYYKYEADNVAGSHKLLTPWRRRTTTPAAAPGPLFTCTAAGQWGTAVAAAAALFGLSPQGAMYSHGYDYPGAPIQAEGMRYHAAPKLVSELYRQGLLEAMAYDERPVFGSARMLFATEGVLPSVEAAYAVHDACVQAIDPANEKRQSCFLVRPRAFRRRFIRCVPQGPAVHDPDGDSASARVRDRVVSASPASSSASRRAASAVVALPT